MRAFDIGYVPKGWKRGEMLSVRPASAARLGVILQSGLPPYPGTGVEPDDIAALMFSPSEAPRVDTWLSWWKA